MGSLLRLHLWHMTVEFSIQTRWTATTPPSGRCTRPQPHNTPPISLQHYRPQTTLARWRNIPKPTDISVDQARASKPPTTVEYMSSRFHPPSLRWGFQTLAALMGTTA